MKKKLLFFLVLFWIHLGAQTELVFVYFKDKPNKQAFYDNPLSELSQKSLDRRARLGIPLNDQDAPIEPTYIQNIQNLGFTVTDYSKWLNGVAVHATPTQIDLISQQPYVDHVESFVRNPDGGLHKNKKDKLEKFDTFQNLTNFEYGVSLQQINQINLRPLHIDGYTGKNISIAVIDTGFPTVNYGTAFKRLRDNNQIKGGYNFVSKNNDIYNLNLNSHGAICLGIIGGYLENQFVGSAPDADFYLYVSEKGNEEIPEEQLYWIEAAEEADRQGVDIISTSLGYTTFDDSRYDYTYEDMNGTTTFISRGSQIAYSKGIILLTAAGNEGSSEWHFISAPADNADVFSIGAVTSSGTPSTFSSYGPNAAGVIKPNVSAQGTDTYYVYNNYYAPGSGTSLATPLAAGGVACLLQALDANMSRDLIKQRLMENASLYPNTDPQMGYGILNFYQTYQFFLGVKDVEKLKINIYPNPAKDYIYFQTDKKIKMVNLYDSLGRLIKQSSENRVGISSLNTGVYWVKVETENGVFVDKLIKQ